MLRECNDIDLNILTDYFVTDELYTKELVLAELIEWQKKEKDFLVLLYGNIDGFLIAHRIRNTLWIHQSWHRPEANLRIAKEALEYARAWGKARGMTAMLFETNRTESRAWQRLGFKEYTVNYRMEL